MPPHPRRTGASIFLADCPIGARAVISFVTGTNDRAINLLFTEALRTRARTYDHFGRTSVDLLRAAAIATLVTAGACLLPGGLAAEDLTAAIVVDSDRPGGYMQLGGGLAHAMVKRRAGSEQRVQVKDPEQARRTAVRSQRSLRLGSAPRRATDDGPPIKFISQTLDPSGQNIIGLTYSPPPPVD